MHRSGCLLGRVGYNCTAPLRTFGTQGGHKPKAPFAHVLCQCATSEQSKSEASTYDLDQQQPSSASVAPGGPPADTAGSASGSNGKQTVDVTSSSGHGSSDAAPAKTVECSTSVDLADGSPLDSHLREFEAHPHEESDEEEYYTDLELEQLVMPPKQQLATALDLQAMSIDDKVSSPLVYNVELAWLAFNWRVLSMALLNSVPLIERLQFLAITETNLDGFFAKRVGGLMKQQAAGSENMKKISGQPPGEQLAAISAEVKRMYRWSAWALSRILLPQLQIQGMRLLKTEDLSSQGLQFLREYYVHQQDKLLTPIKLDPAHPFPYLPSGSLNIAVELRDPAARRTLEYTAGMVAIVNIPSSLPRWVQVPSKFARSESNSWKAGFISLETIIIQNLDCLFAGMTIESAHAFRVTRNAELDRQEEAADDLLDMIADELRERRFAPFVRLEVDNDMPLDLLEFLSHELRLDKDQDVYRVEQMMGLEQLTKTVRSVMSDSSLVYAPWKPTAHPRLANPFQRRYFKANWSGRKWKDIRSIFDVIREGDLLLHHPYQSFASSTQRFVEEAARDPAVVAIKTTLYRTSSDSPIIAALLKAAENGKQVAVLVELKARFDEARNVGFAQRLEDAGCNVAYGIVGLKTHAKCMLVVREEKSAEHGLRTYVHIGTGNYNPSTASVYTDLGLLSADPELGEDVVDLFKLLTGIHRQSAVGGFRKLVVGNEYMKSQFLALIDREIDEAKAGRPAALCIKVNGLDDKVMCAKLYEAAEAGVRVDCIVRGVCRLRPAASTAAGDRIRVVSVIGRFLEHHRVYCFFNGGKPLYYIGSADWMRRNLDKRIEVAVPVVRTRSRERLREALSLCLLDKTAWEMRPDGSYNRPATRTEEASKAAPLLHQRRYRTAQLEVLEQEGVQGCLMWSIWEKIRHDRESGVIF